MSRPTTTLCERCCGALRTEQRYEAASDGVGDVVAEFGRINAANVVGLENRGIDSAVHSLRFFDRASVTPL